MAKFMNSTPVKVTLGDEDLGVFDFQKMTVSDSIRLKGASGLTPKQFIDGLSEMDGLAMQTLVWLLRTRQGKVADLRAIDFAVGDLDLEELPDPTKETSGTGDAGTSVSSPTSAT